MTNPPARSTFRPPVSGRLVVLAPHPDDETLGCGLLIARAMRAGVGVAVVALTDGQGSHPNSARWPAAALGLLRRGEMRRALARLGANRAVIRFMGWHDGRLAHDGSALRLRALLVSLRASVVVVASPADHHPDHRAAWQLAVAATKGTSIVLKSYAVWSQLDAPPAGRVRDRFTGAKRWAMLAHRSQISAYISDDPKGFTFDAEPLGRLLREPETLRLGLR